MYRIQSANANAANAKNNAKNNSKNNAANANRFVSILMNSRTQAHKFHLGTTSYAQHKALQSYYEKIVDLLDDYAEAYMGKYGRMTGIQLNSRFMRDPEKARPYFEALLDRIQQLNLPRDTYLRNIQDEIVGLVRKTLYMLSLK
jgi:DNA-binding ferritin-like protein